MAECEREDLNPTRLPKRQRIAKAIEELLEEAVDLVRRSVPPERRDAELANLTAVANEIVGGIRARPRSD
jgi:hypothetical protein